MTPDKERILETLRTAVNAKEISEHEVAKLSRLSQGHISKLVTGRSRQPRAKTVEAIGAALATLVPHLATKDLVVARIHALNERIPSAMPLVVKMIHLVEEFADLDRPQ